MERNGRRQLIICLFSFMSVPAWQAAMAFDLPTDPAQTLARRAIDAMGGQKALGGIQSLRLTAHAYRRMLEQSERPEGPWIPSFTYVTQWIGFDGSRIRTKITYPHWKYSVTTTAMGAKGVRKLIVGTEKEKITPARRRDLRQLIRRVALGPERVLFTALAANDLHTEPLTYLQDVPHRVLAFTWGDAPVRIFLNAHTLLPTAVEITRPLPYDVFWNLWGDVTTRIYFSSWTLRGGGLRYPQQWDIWRNDQPYRTVYIDQLDMDATPPSDNVPISEAQLTAFPKEGTVDEIHLAGEVQELAPGVVLLPGSWNSTLVAQSDGVVIIEAPISSGYSAAVLTEVASRFPDRPVKAVVTTSDAWPHVGGIREYVSRGTPLYLLDLNVPFIKAVLRAPHRMRPDALARHPQTPRLHVVSGRAVIGEGANRIELYPVRGESGERMMLVYFPQYRLLYASDLVQFNLDGSFAFPEYLSEVARVVAQEGLQVERVFAMHTPHAVPWQTIKAAIARAVMPVSADIEGR